MAKKTASKKTATVNDVKKKFCPLETKVAALVKKAGLKEFVFAATDGEKAMLRVECSGTFAKFVSMKMLKNLIIGG